MNDALHGSPTRSSTSAGLHPAIEFIGVDKRFPARGQNPEVVAAHNVTLSIQPGEVVSLIGPSGCGKSTLLNMGSGLAKASAGIVKVNGEVVTGPNKHVAFMLQKDLLMPWRTIAQNVEFGLELRGVKASERRDNMDPVHSVDKRCDCSIVLNFIGKTQCIGSFHMALTVTGNDIGMRLVDNVGVGFVSANALK